MYYVGGQDRRRVLPICYADKASRARGQEYATPDKDLALQRHELYATEAIAGPSYTGAAGGLSPRNLELGRARDASLDHPVGMSVLIVPAFIRLGYLRMGGLSEAHDKSPQIHKIGLNG